MKLKFPFKVKQVSPKEVEVDFDTMGQPILEWQVHSDVREAIGDGELEELYTKTLGSLVRASIKVQ